MIWLIGNKGMLGTELTLLLKEKGLSFIGTDKEADITDKKALREYVSCHTSENKKIKWIVNCAAYTAVDKAEDDIDLCKSVNEAGAGNISAISKEIDAVMIHISTDYVFNGKNSIPYTEENETDPIGVYGLTKRDGEIKVLKENEKSYIIRTAWLYGEHGNNFVHTMLRLMKEKESVSVVNDQKGSPTWAYDLAQSIIELIKQTDEGKTIPYGIYHYTNEGEITWYEFSKEIYKQAKTAGILEKDCEIKPCTSAEYPAKVKRPAYSVLSKSKIKTMLKMDIPAWNESFKNFLNIKINRS